MLPQGVEGFRADVMLDAAGILEGDLLADPHPDKNLCQAVMAVVGFFSDLAAFGGEGDALVGIQFQVALGGKAPELLADGGAGELHVVGDVDSSYVAIFLLEDENGLEIHLSGFLTVHALTRFPINRTSLILTPKTLTE